MPIKTPQASPPDETQPSAAAELRKQLEEKAKATEEAASSKPADPKDQKEYDFEVDLVDRRGRPWKGKFTNKILNLGQKRQVSIIMARMADGLPVESLEGLQTELNRATAHMEYSLVKKPEWAENFDNLDTSEPLFAVWSEVASHEATFHRFSADTESSQKDG